MNIFRTLRSFWVYLILFSSLMMLLANPNELVYSFQAVSQDTEYIDLYQHGNTQIISINGVKLGNEMTRFSNTEIYDEIVVDFYGESFVFEEIDFAISRSQASYVLNLYDDDNFYFDRDIAILNRLDIPKFLMLVVSLLSGLGLILGIAQFFVARSRRKKGLYGSTLLELVSQSFYTASFHLSWIIFILFFIYEEGLYSYSFMMRFTDTVFLIALTGLILLVLMYAFWRNSRHFAISLYLGDDGAVVYKHGKSYFEAPYHQLVYELEGRDDSASPGLYFISPLFWILKAQTKNQSIKLYDKNNSENRIQLSLYTMPKKLFRQMTEVLMDKSTDITAQIYEENFAREDGESFSADFIGEISKKEKNWKVWLFFGLGLVYFVFVIVIVASLQNTSGLNHIMGALAIWLPLLGGVFYQRIKYNKALKNKASVRIDANQTEIKINELSFRYAEIAFISIPKRVKTKRTAAKSIVIKTSELNTAILFYGMTDGSNLDDYIDMLAYYLEKNQLTEVRRY